MSIPQNCNPAEIHEKYHLKTNSYESLIKNGDFTYFLLIKLLNKYIDSKTLMILDIGCGAGTLSLYLASKGYKVLGIDISQRAIDVCRQSAQKLGLKNVIFKQALFPEEVKNKDKFDFILFTEVIEHIENDNIALKKIYNLLKPKGIVFLTTPSINAPLYKLGLTKKFDKEVGHVRRYSLDELKHEIEKQHFDIIAEYKQEGILRNFLFINPIAGILIRVINKFKLANIITFFDNVSLHLFGESDLVVVFQKVEK